MIKPDASRQTSAEIYVLAKHLKPNATANAASTSLSTAPTSITSINNTNHDSNR